MNLLKTNIIAKFIKTGLLVTLFMNFSLGWVAAFGEHECSSDCHAEILSGCCETMEEPMEMECHRSVNLAADVSLDSDNCGCEEFQPLNQDKFDTIKRLVPDIKPLTSTHQHDNEDLICRIEYSQTELQTNFTLPPIYISVSSLLI